MFSVVGCVVVLLLLMFSVVGCVVVLLLCGRMLYDYRMEDSMSLLWEGD